jgi:hypothetical protein
VTNNHAKHKTRHCLFFSVFFLLSEHPQGGRCYWRHWRGFDDTQVTGGKYLVEFTGHGFLVGASLIDRAIDQSYCFGLTHPYQYWIKTSRDRVVCLLHGFSIVLVTFEVYRLFL